MKTAFKQHLTSFKTTCLLLSKRKFIVYFAPAIIITFFYVSVTLLLPNMFSEYQTQQDSWLSASFSKIGQVIDFLLTQLYVFIVLTCLSPFHTMLSQKVDTHLNDQLFLVNIRHVISDFFRMIFIFIVALFFQLFAVLIWWIVARLFGFHTSFIYYFVTFLISAFSIGFSFYDYSLERHRIGVFGSIKFAFSQWSIVLLTGIVFKGLYAFPYIWDISYLGIVIAPVFTTCLSTVIYLKNIPKEQSIIRRS